MCFFEYTMTAKIIIKTLTRMWTDAQRDGRPAEYTWRPLRKFGNSILVPRHKVWLTPAAVQ